MTDFSKKVYEAVKKIPRGRVTTYKKIATIIGCSAASRAVGNALNKNRSENVPCHRIVRSDGLVGRFNRGSREKIKILRQEGVKVIGHKVDKKFIV